MVLSMEGESTSKCKIYYFVLFAILILAPAQVCCLTSGEEDQVELLGDSVGFEGVEELLECFQCDLGFWDACYTTRTNCSLGERCYTGRGRAADILDVKTLGCVKAEECDVETTMELFFNKTIFVMTRHCCNTPFCNTAHKHLVYTPLYLIVGFFTTWLPQ